MLTWCVKLVVMIAATLIFSTLIIVQASKFVHNDRHPFALKQHALALFESPAVAT